MDYHISVIIPTYNRCQQLYHCLEGLKNQTMSKDFFEVIVVDDDSSDGTQSLLQRTQAERRISLRYYHQAHRGPAEARNFGIQESKGNFTAFTDDDCIPSSDWLSDLMSAFPEDPLCAGIGGSIVRYRETLIGRYIDYRGTMNHAVHKGEILYLVTGNALYRRSCLLEVRGFNSRIHWPGGEDPDLSLRLRECGYYFISTSRGIVKHQHRDTILGLFKTAYNHGRGNYALFTFGHRCIGKNRQWNKLPKLLKDDLKDIMRFSKMRDFSFRERFIFPFLRFVEIAGSQFGYNSQKTLI
jgi:glycosyltransferase involved in cell wall biosynthesis